jgi:hypothetical protein
MPKDPVAPYERSRQRSELDLKRRYPNVRFDETMNVQPYLKWLLDNMDRDHYTFRHGRIWFSNDGYLRQFLNQFPKLYFNHSAPIAKL